MFYLMVLLCSNPQMDDCMLYQEGAWQTERQCEIMASISRDSLKSGDNPNFRVRCIYQP